MRLSELKRVRPTCLEVGGLMGALQLSGARVTVARGRGCEFTLPAESLYSAAENSGRPPVAKRQERASR
jgi:hypothetical protein